MQNNKNKDNITRNILSFIDKVNEDNSILNKFSNQEKQYINKLSKDIINLMECKFKVDEKIFNDLSALEGKEGEQRIILKPEKRAKPLGGLQDREKSQLTSPQQGRVSYSKF